MTSIFFISYGSEKREERILKYLEDDYIVAVILAATHFEWMIKRSILKLGHSSTVALRKKLESAYKLSGEKEEKQNLQLLWKDEVAKNYRNASLGTVLSNLTFLKEEAKVIRGFLVHGNGLSSKKDARKAVEQYILASNKLRLFAKKNGQNLDSRLSARRVKRSSKLAV